MVKKCMTSMTSTDFKFFHHEKLCDKRDNNRLKVFSVCDNNVWIDFKFVHGFSGGTMLSQTLLFFQCGKTEKYFHSSCHGKKKE